MGVLEAERDCLISVIFEAMEVAASLRLSTRYSEGLAGRRGSPNVDDCGDCASPSTIERSLEGGRRRGEWGSVEDRDRLRGVPTGVRGAKGTRGATGTMGGATWGGRGRDL